MAPVRGCEEALALERLLVLSAIHHLGSLYGDQGKLDVTQKTS